MLDIVFKSLFLSKKYMQLLLFEQDSIFISMTEIFKNFEELEEYFKNLGIEYRFSCYYEKNGEGLTLSFFYFDLMVFH